MITAYCRRRGSRDPEGISAEVIAIAWGKRDELNLKHCRPWLIATARNLLSDEYRARRRSIPTAPEVLAEVDPRQEADFEVESLDPELGRALDSLSPSDREAVLLVAWEELTPAEAARSMGIRPATFRVRLHRARGRLKQTLDELVAGPAETTKSPLEDAI
jgi:RNA polymerase sigma-70 factor (ECF subfamily)